MLRDKTGKKIKKRIEKTTIKRIITIFDVKIR
jgi:hypothetical protein